MFCLRRLESLSAAEFDAYWWDVHGPLVAARASLLGIRKYVQRRRADPVTYQQLAASRDAPPSYDGVAELWVDRAALTAQLPLPGRLAARELLEDERRFIDLAASPIFVVNEHEIPLLPTAAVDEEELR
jgi:hypothetical protein